MGGRIGVSGNCSLGHRSLDYRFLMLHFPFAPQKTEENMFAREKRGTGKEAKEKEKRERNVEGMFRANKGKGVKEEEKVVGTGWLQKDKGEKRWKNRDGKRRRASRKERGKGRRWGAKGRGGRSGWSRLEMERRRSESEWNRLDRAKERTVWWPWTINATGSFCRFLFSRRIPSNAHTVQYVRAERSDHVDWLGRGGEARVNLSRRFFAPVSLSRLPVWWLVSTHRVAPMKRWRTANARRQHIPVLPNGPRYTPRRTSPRASPPHRFHSWERERYMARLDEALQPSRWRDEDTILAGQER